MDNARVMPRRIQETPGVQFAEIAWDGRTIRIEYERLNAGAGGPLIVFLHEGLGSRAMWREFPRELCEAAGARGLVFSRPGYGRSTVLDPAARRTDYLHRQSREVLPAFLSAVGVDEPPILFGHSDGASIALLYAAAFPARVKGLVAVAPHIFVEDVTLKGLAHMREIYAHTGLESRLGRYHDDADSVFRGWNDIWLQPAFRDWNIERDIEPIRAPLLAVQGVDDDYGTLEQIRGIARRVPHTQLLELQQCGHSPHRDRPEALIAATVAFIGSR
jgi:pimeloyl-ACP methyl ester carboxylesterase